MLIADSQVHIWGPNTPERPWKPGRKAQRPVPLGADEVLCEMDAAGVDRVVIVPPSIEGGRNDLAIAAVRSHPDRFAIMGRLELEDPAARGRLAHWRDQPGMFGVRINFKSELKKLPTDPDVEWFWAEAERAGVRVFASVMQADAHSVATVAKRHPDLRIAVDHLGIVNDTQKGAEAFANLDRLLALADNGNVAVKVSSMPGYASDGYPYRSLHPYLRRVYDAFGPKRMFWGSDLSRLHGPYRECVTMFTEEMNWLTSDDLDWIMGRGLCEWLGWKVQEQAGGFRPIN